MYSVYTIIKIEHIGNANLLKANKQLSPSPIDLAMYSPIARIKFVIMSNKFTIFID